LPPDLPFHGTLEVSVVTGPEPGTEVLPSAVGEEADDVALVDALGDAQRSSEDSAGGYPGEDPFPLEQVSGHAEALFAADHDAGIQEVFVPLQDGGDKPFLQ